MARIALIDNYDSFTWNLVHLIGATGADVTVYRNDAITIDALRALQPDAIVLSPGPCTPNEAGICLDVIAELGSEIPQFGVCLGMQAMGQTFGGTVVRAPRPMHGKISDVTHTGKGLFRGINGTFAATRYHSLIIDRTSVPESLSITAEADGLIMALSHKTLPVHGVQFHPESILSEHGTTIIRNFLDLAANWNTSRRTPQSA
ncbi:anthranilate synthase component II [Pseudochelatococcus sp. G4_1912]|uniref:anthranilate synthase component II n=1 Tax=Pseudochelatococcus sp. G4_1912 TaxID=3114288 RepID=UPI0039C70F4E